MTRALIVGRSRIHRDALASILARGDRVRVVGMASHREEVFSQLEAERPDIVLIDVTMSDVAGTAAEIRARAPGVKVVAITLGETEAEVVRLAEAGVAGYVVADASLEDLTVAVESAVRGELFCSPRVAFTLLRRVGAMANQIRSAEGETGPLSELTLREQEILKLVDQGMSNKEIAKQLGIGLATAKNHVHHILEKLHVHRRINASIWYRRGGFHLKLEGE
jgi:DNA-binding NarL/FixJ family response regulator